MSRVHIRMVIAGVESFLSNWLGDAASAGANSWLHALTWLATVAAAFFAGWSIRRQSLQSRAQLLLHLYERWEALAPERRAFNTFFNSVRRHVAINHPLLENKHQMDEMKTACHEAFVTLREAEHPFFFQFVRYVSFFETLGAYVRNGYVPLNHAAQLYKGPVLDLEIAASKLVQAWQKEAHTPSGLLENGLYLMREMRLREERPIYSRTAYKLLRYIPYFR